jgi:tRNA(fMet)-specific endonuclease VapC
VRFLLDTDTCVFWLRGHERVRERLVAVGPAEVGVSIISLAELRYGAESSARPEANHRAIDAFLSGIALLNLDQPSVRTFGLTKAALRSQGMLIEDFDLHIAATALTSNLIVVTQNVDHFGRVANLSVESWAS